MKLIKEITETVNYITEDANGQKVLHIEGPFLVAERKRKKSMKKEKIVTNIQQYIFPCVYL